MILVLAGSSLRRLLAATRAGRGCSIGWMFRIAAPHVLILQIMSRIRSSQKRGFIGT